MQKADLFAYLAAFVTIVLAIALTDMIQSTHRLLRARGSVKWDLLSPLLALWVFLWVLSEFFSLWFDARFDRITFYGLVGLMVVPTLTALAAYAALPDEVPPDGLDLERFYFDNRKYLIALLMLINIGDVGRVVHYAFQYDGFAELDPWLPLLAIWIATFSLLATMYFIRARWAQLMGIIGLFVFALLGFGGAQIQAGA